MPWIGLAWRLLTSYVEQFARQTKFISGRCVVLTARQRMADGRAATAMIIHTASYCYRHCSYVSWMESRIRRLLLLQLRSGRRWCDAVRWALLLLWRPAVLCCCWFTHPDFHFALSISLPPLPPVCLIVLCFICQHKYLYSYSLPCKSICSIVSVHLLDGGSRVTGPDTIYRRLAKVPTRED